MGLTDSARRLIAKFEVLQDLETKVRELMAEHEAKRQLWFPSELLGPEEGESPEEHTKELRRRAAGIPDAARTAIALNLLTEEGLPHFHRLLAVYLGDDSFWRTWNNLWTAEEDRHGVVLHDYVRESRLLDQRGLDKLQFEYLRSGFHPEWDRDPYRVFAYTSLQERATQHSHSEVGKQVAEYEPRLANVLRLVAGEEARHYSFYRTIFSEILARDPNEALYSASLILPALQMPGVNMPGFSKFADVVRRAGIYGPRDYLRIAQEQIRLWKIDGLTGLNELGRKAQEKIMALPERLKRLADHVELRSDSKTFSFEVVFNREFAVP